MKQQITPYQLSQLSVGQLEGWANWCKRNRYPVKATIGQLIHYLYEHEKLKTTIGPSRLTYTSFSWQVEEELIDLLWKRITEIPSIDSNQ